MAVGVDDTRHEQEPAAVDEHPGVGPDLRRRADARDPPAVDGDGAVGDHPVMGVHGDDVRAAYDEVVGQAAASAS